MLDSNNCELITVQLIFSFNFMVYLPLITDSLSICFHLEV